MATSHFRWQETAIGDGPANPLYPGPALSIAKCSPIWPTVASLASLTWINLWCINMSDSKLPNDARFVMVAGDKP